MPISPIVGTNLVCMSAITAMAGAVLIIMGPIAFEKILKCLVASYKPRSRSRCRR